MINTIDSVNKLTLKNLHKEKQEKTKLYCSLNENTNVLKDRLFHQKHVQHDLTKLPFCKESMHPVALHHTHSSILSINADEAIGLHFQVTP